MAYKKFLKNKLQIGFYSGNVNQIAKNLLGKIFVLNSPKFLFTGKIVEVEAYHGKSDKAAHSYNGVTKRNKVMFKKGGLLYVYCIYGIHFCANIVTGNEGEGDAVLLRGIEPITGIDKMAKNRYNLHNLTNKQLVNLTNGPAKLCKAFGIDLRMNGADLTSDQIFISAPEIEKEFEIVETSRIGITKSVDLNWRYYIKDNRFISKK